MWSEMTQILNITLLSKCLFRCNGESQLIKREAEWCPPPLYLPLIDPLVRQHSAPGAPQVVVGVEDVGGGEQAVPGRDLVRGATFYYKIVKYRNKYLKPCDCNLGFLFINKFCEDKVSGGVHTCNGTVDVLEIMILQ